jgi:hypothetical protein
MQERPLSMLFLLDVSRKVAEIPLQSLLPALEPSPEQLQSNVKVKFETTKWKSIIYDLTCLYAQNLSRKRDGQSSLSSHGGPL